MPSKGIKICRDKGISKTFQCGLNEYLTLLFGECLLITQTRLERHILQGRKSFLLDSGKIYFVYIILVTICLRFV